MDARPRRTAPGAALAARLPVIDPFAIPVPLVTLVLLLALWLAGFALPRLASGQIVIDDPPRNSIRWPFDRPPVPAPDFLFQPAAIETRAELNGQIARVTVEQRYENHFGREIEGTFLFPLPRDASISDFAMYVDGRKLDGEILDRDEARAIYEDIVRRKKDPALLEQVGSGLLRARLYPIPAGGERTIKIEYTQFVKSEAALREFRFPTLACPGGADVPLSIDIAIRTEGTLGTLYSPSHDVRIDRQGRRLARVTYDGATGDAADLVLYYALDESEIGMQLLAHAESGEDGYFLLIATPRPEETGRRAPRDLVFVLDSSGSMRGEKIAQARDALDFAVQHLGSHDRFNLVVFSDGVRRFRRGLVRATAENVAEARRFIGGIQANGGTNIDAALRAGLLDVRSSGRGMLLFLTDGLPTVGLTDTRAILDGVRRHVGDARIFVFGVGYDVNAPFLDLVADVGRAASAYVRPEENIRTKVEALHRKIASPAVTDLAARFSGGEAYDLYPERIPDLFAGEQVVLLGRYRDAGSTRVTLRGRRDDGSPFSLSTNARLPRRNEGRDFIPNLWASRKIGALLDRIRLEGERREWVDQVVALSKEYGVMTEYTAYLVEEPAEDVAGVGRRDFRRPDTGWGRSASGFRDTPGGGARQTLQAPARPGAEPGRDLPSGAGALDLRAEIGKQAVDNAISIRELKEKSSLSSKDEDASRFRREGKVAFEKKGAVWTDTRHTRKAEVVRVRAFGEAYFALLEKLPWLRRYFAIGDRVILSAGGLSIEVSPDGAETLSAREIERVVKLAREP